MDFKDADKAGNLIHGGYVDNLHKIFLAGGAYPSNMLKEGTKPVVGYLRGPVIWHPDKLSVCELYTHPYGCKYSLQEQRLWGNPVFHFTIVSNYPYREHSKSFEQLLSEGLESSEYGKPWYYDGEEIALKNQGLSLDTFVAFVLPHDELIEGISRISRYSHIFENLGKRLSMERIRGMIQNELKLVKLSIPIFDVGGNPLD